MLAAMSFCLRAGPALAGPPEPLDAAFLDYLLACEGKDDNWTVVADEQLRKKAAKVPAKETPPAKLKETPPAVKP